MRLIKRNKEAFKIYVQISMQHVRGNNIPMKASQCGSRISRKRGLKLDVQRMRRWAKLYNLYLYIQLVIEKNLFWAGILPARDWVRPRRQVDRPANILQLKKQG